MKSLQKEMNTAIIFITHDMGLAKLIADKVLVLENGRIAENQAFLSTKIQTSADNNTDVDTQPLLSVQDIAVVFKDTRGFFQSKSTHNIIAVDKVSFEIHKGTTLGLVGGSGCGKSTVSKCILGLQNIQSGAIYFEDKRIDNQHSKNFPDYRKAIQMVFQDPYASLNPRLTVKDVLTELIHIHKICNKDTIESYINGLLDKVGLPISAKHKYPHEFSGGQRQRICIARALAVQPQLIVCDESVAALDVKMQQQILALLMTLQKEMQLSYLFISHDLKLVAQISNHIIVMQSGKIVESNDALSLMQSPQHLYTKELIAAIV